MANAGAAAAVEEAAAAQSHPEIATGENNAEDVPWRPTLGLPCKITVDLPLPDFKVSDFLKLRPASVIDAHWRLGRDVPLHLNGTLIGWVEFEVVGNNLAVRLTELA
jgi:flagellar motor switch/type III secretory pathway protein FliN